MALPAAQDLNIYQGDSFSLSFTFYVGALTYGSENEITNTTLNLTGCTVRSQIRKTAKSASILQALTTTLDVPSATVVISLTGSQTAALKAGTFAWDLELTFPNSQVDTYVAGNVNVVQQVTR